MKSILVVLKKEYKHFFNSPVGLIVMVSFIIAVNAKYVFTLFQFNQADMRSFFELLPLIFIIFIPAVTMRSWAEERKTGTLEILLATGMNPLKLIIGKFLGSWLFVVVATLLTLTIPITLNTLANPDLGVILAGYVGTMLLAAMYVAVGQLISANSKNQIVGLILGWASLGVLYVLGIPQIYPVGLRFLAELLGSGNHFLSIGKGLIDLRDIMYYVILTVIAFCLTRRSLLKIKRTGK